VDGTLADPFEHLLVSPNENKVSHDEILFFFTSKHGLGDSVFGTIYNNVNSIGYFFKLILLEILIPIY
jgi:hypothetical protein